MHTLVNFWKSLEHVLGLADVPAAWRAQLDSEFDHVQAFLRPRGGLATYFPRLEKSPFEDFEVITLGPDDHVGVCAETGERKKLTTADITIHEIDQRRLSQQIAAALGCEFQPAPMNLPRSSRLGDYVVAGGQRHPVYLTMPLDPRSLRSVIDRLVATEAGPFLLLAPTRKRCTADGESLLRTKGAGLIALAEVLALDATGRLVSTDAAKVQLDVFRRLALSYRQPPCTVDEPYVFRRQGAMWILAYEGKSVVVPHLRGLQHVAQAIAKPYQLLPIAALVAEAAANDAPRAAGSSGVKLDQDAIDAYRERVRELNEEIEEAERYRDTVRHERLCEQRAMLESEVASAVGLGRRLREDSDTERLRVQVKNAVTRAVARVKKVHAELACHLTQSLHTGLFVSYEPPAPIPWAA
jgi:hypothetical protein